MSLAEKTHRPETGPEWPRKRKQVPRKLYTLCCIPRGLSQCVERRAIVCGGLWFTFARSYPQTDFATLATSSSLRRWSSGVMRLPSIVEAKPHCGLRASRSSGTYFEASSIL